MTPSPRLDEIRQGQAQPTRGLPDFLVVPRNHLAGALQARPTFPKVSSNVKVSVCPNIKGKTRGITPGGFLDDYIEWNPPGVIPRVFPLMSGHTVTLTLLETIVEVGSALRGTHELM